MPRPTMQLCAIDSPLDILVLQQRSLYGRTCEAITVRASSHGMGKLDVKIEGPNELLYEFIMGLCELLHVESQTEFDGTFAAFAVDKTDDQTPLEDSREENDRETSSKIAIAAGNESIQDYWDLLNATFPPDDGRPVQSPANIEASMTESSIERVASIKSETSTQDKSRFEKRRRGPRNDGNSRAEAIDLVSSEPEEGHSAVTRVRATTRSGALTALVYEINATEATSCERDTA